MLKQVGARGCGIVTLCKTLVATRQRAVYINPFKPEFTIVIFIHYKPKIAAAILDL